MRPRAYLLASLAILPLLLGGCFTLQNQGLDGESAPRVYGGTRTLIEVVSLTPDEVEGYIDLPFSLVGDTLLLPVTLVQAAVD